MGSTMKPTRSLFAVVVICGWFVFLRGNIDVEENWKRCRAKADEDPSNGTLLEFCGYELGGNYQHDSYYDCINGTPEFSFDCTKSIYGDRHAPDIHCSKKNDHTAEYLRLCLSIVYCTPKRDFCGFKSEQEVRNEIIRTIPNKVHRGSQMSFYNRQLERGKNSWIEFIWIMLIS